MKKLQVITHRGKFAHFLEELGHSIRTKDPVAAEVKVCEGGFNLVHRQFLGLEAGPLLWRYKICRGPLREVCSHRIDRNGTNDRSARLGLSAGRGGRPARAEPTTGGCHDVRATKQGPTVVFSGQSSSWMDEAVKRVEDRNEN